MSDLCCARICCALQVESVLNDFVRLREECSYHDSGTALEGGYGMAELMADDEDVYQLGG
jgi:hypothetical protein